MTYIRTFLHIVALPLILVLIWFVATLGEASFFVPTPQLLIETFFETWTSERFVSDVFPSLGRLTTGIALSILIGIGDEMKVSVIVLGAVWPILLNTIEGVRSMDEVLADTSRTYGMTKFYSVRYLILPSAMPQIMAGIRQSLSIALILMVISEMFASTEGLGFAIVQFQRSFAIPEMWSGIVLLGLIGVVLSFIFQLTERWVLGWYHGLREIEQSA